MLKVTSLYYIIRKYSDTSTINVVTLTCELQMILLSVLISHEIDAFLLRSGKKTAIRILWNNGTTTMKTNALTSGMQSYERSMEN